MTVEALRRRRPETLADLLATYGRELQSVAYLILRDRSEAEDVVIETLLTAFEKGGSVREERALRRTMHEDVRQLREEIRALRAELTRQHLLRDRDEKR